MLCAHGYVFFFSRCNYCQCFHPQYHEGRRRLQHVCRGVLLFVFMLLCSYDLVIRLFYTLLQWLTFAFHVSKVEVNQVSTTDLIEQLTPNHRDHPSDVFHVVLCTMSGKFLQFYATHTPPLQHDLDFRSLTAPTYYLGLYACGEGRLKKETRYPLWSVTIPSMKERCPDSLLTTSEAQDVQLRY